MSFSCQLMGSSIAGLDLEPKDFVVFDFSREAEGDTGEYTTGMYSPYFALSKFQVGPTTPGPVALSPESVLQASPEGEQPMYVEEGGGIVISDGGGDSGGGGGGLGGAMKTCTLVPMPLDHTTLASALLSLIIVLTSFGLLAVVRETKKNR